MESFIGYLGVGKIENELLDDTILMFNKLLDDEGNLPNVRLKKIFPSSMPIPATSYNHTNGKYSIEPFFNLGIRVISSIATLKKDIRLDKVVLITPLPLFSHTLNCRVTGEADANGRIAVISYDTMKHDDPELMRTRICKELFFLVGCLYGLSPCRNEGCAMKRCANLNELDEKGTSLCEECAKLFSDRLSKSSFGDRYV